MGRVFLLPAVCRGLMRSPGHALRSAIPGALALNSVACQVRAEDLLYNPDIIIAQVRPVKITLLGTYQSRAHQLEEPSHATTEPSLRGLLPLMGILSIPH